MRYKSHSHGYNKKEMQEANPVGIDYLVRNERIKQDHTNKIPNKELRKVRLPWGIYGYTYLQHNEMWLNDLLDYTPKFKKKVAVHEGIHTHDEYETRVISEDMVKEEPREDIIEILSEEPLNWQKPYIFLDYQRRYDKEDMDWQRAFSQERQKKAA